MTYNDSPLKTELLFILLIPTPLLQAKPVRVLVITGGHGYQEKEFNEMLSPLGKDISSQVVSFPDAFDMFRPENREKSGRPRKHG